MRKEKKMWYSPPFSTADKVRVNLAVYPSKVGRGQGSHLSVSLIFIAVVEKEEDLLLVCNVTVTAAGQYRSATHYYKVLALCAFREEITM